MSIRFWQYYLLIVGTICVSFCYLNGSTGLAVFVFLIYGTLLLYSTGNKYIRDLLHSCKWL